MATLASRYEGGVTLIQAWVRNVRTRQSDGKGDVQVGRPRKRLNIDAEHRDGNRFFRETNRKTGILFGPRVEYDTSQKQNRSWSCY
jgi:hypothetical protein